MDENIEDIIWELSEPQDRLLRCRQAFMLDMAGQGSGKTGVIGISTGELISKFPAANGFIGANTLDQLSDSTLVGVFKIWRLLYGWTEYDPVSNPSGDYIVDKKPPKHFTILTQLKKYHNIISFRKGTVVFVGSLLNYKAHDGKEFTWAHLDETKDTKQEALTDVILGRLRQVGLWYDQYGKMHWETDAAKGTANGWTSWNPIMIHTSPAIGVAEWINEMFDLNKYEDPIREEVYKKEHGYYYREFKNKAVCIYSSFHNRVNLPPEFFKNQLLNLTAAKADKLIYGLPFSKNGGEFYPNFERREFVKKVKYLPGLASHLTWDFNNMPYMTMLACQIQFVTRYIDAGGVKHDEWEPGWSPIEVTRLRVYKEYCYSSPKASTEAVCNGFRIDHADESNVEIYYYGDSNGLSKFSGLGGLSNFKIMEDELRDYLHNGSKRVKHPNVAPLKRRDLLNNIFMGVYPEIEIEIDEECVILIKDLEKLKEGKNGKLKPMVKNKETGQSYEELGHTSDALEYFVSEVLKDYIKGIR